MLELGVGDMTEIDLVAGCKITGELVCFKGIVIALLQTGRVLLGFDFLLLLDLGG